MPALSQRDRNLLLGCLALVISLILILTIFTPHDDAGNSPSSYSNDTHGTKAVYLLLAQSGYRVEQWSRPIRELASTSDAHTVLLLLDPNPSDTDAIAGTVREVLARGGRVLATGLTGAAMLPDAEAAPGGHGPAHPCQAEANGFGPLTVAPTLPLSTAAAWKAVDPRFEVAYTCEGLASVVSYKVGPGEAIWWSTSLPIENAKIAQSENLQFFLASLGSAKTARVVWNEAPVSAGASLWSYTEGTPLHLVWWQLALVATLLLASFGRRSGPLRADPVISRAAPIEFVTAMGALYRKSHATNAVVTLAYNGFLDRLDRYLPVRSLERSAGASAIALLLEQRGVISSPETAGTLQQDLLACHAARWADPLGEQRALYLVRALHDHERRFMTHIKPTLKNSSRTRKTREVQ
jgi:hypothetical protein